MAPEHSAAWDDLTNRQPISHAVDGRADIYSLGLLLCEALTGEVPPNVQKLRTLKRDLRDILAKCLEREPSKRYASAGELAHALRRHLNHQSRMRRPSSLTGLLLSTAIVFGSVAFGWKMWSEQANKDQIESKFADAMTRFHDEVERLRFVADSPHFFEFNRFEIWRYWDNRERILARSLDLSPERQEQVRSDLLEVAFFLIDRDQEIISQAEACFGDDLVRRIREMEPESASPRELVIIAQRLLKANQLHRAELVLRDVLRTQPDDFWSWFRLGQVQFRQEAFDDAIASFSVCIGRKPECAECWFNRGVVLMRMSRFDDARRDFEQVLRITHGHTQAEAMLERCLREIES